MPQTNNHYDITLNTLYVMSTVLQYKHAQIPNKASLIEREAKNPVLTCVTALDMMGLTWIFQEDDI